MIRANTIRSHATVAALSLFAIHTQGGSAKAQEVRAYTTADTLSVGERFELVVVARHPLWANAIFPSPPPDSAGEFLQIGDILILSATSKLSHETGETAIDSVLYSATTFELDTAIVGRVPIGFVSDRDTITVLSQAFLLPVRSVMPPDAEDILDIAPLAEFPRPVWPWLLFLALLIAAMAAFVFWYRRSPEVIGLARGEAPAQRLPPLEEAANRLDALRTAHLETDASKKAFFVELSDILRTYLSRRLEVPALERTSREVLADLTDLEEQDGFPGAVLDSTSQLLDISDLAKFAEIYPTEPRCREFLDTAGEIVENVEAHLTPEALPAEEAQADEIIETT